MKKLWIIPTCMLALIASALNYQVQMDADGNLIGKETLITKNGLAEKTEVIALSNAVNAVQAKFQLGTPSADGTLTLVATDSGNVIDTGIPLENLQWQVGVTNVAQVAAFIAAGGQPYSYAKLDENGKIDPNALSNIILIYGGGSAY